MILRELTIINEHRRLQVCVFSLKGRVCLRLANRGKEQFGKIASDETETVSGAPDFCGHPGSSVPSLQHIVSTTVLLAANVSLTC